MPTLTLPELEAGYDRLAEAVDQAGEHSELFLAKLVLLLAQAVGDGAVLQRSIDAALADLKG